MGRGDLRGVSLEDALNGHGGHVHATKRATQANAVRTAGWGLNQLLSPRQSGITGGRGLGPLKKGQIGAPGIGEQVSNIIEAAPSGAFHLAKGVATDPLAAAAAGALIGGGVSAETGPGALIGAGVGGVVGAAGYGIKSLLGDGGDPLATSKEFIASAGRTANRLIHPTQYARAVKRGEIIAALVEDVANLSMVAHGAGAALDATTGGAASKAAEAGAAMQEAKGVIAKSGAEADRLSAEARVPGLDAETAKGKVLEANKHYKSVESADAAYKKAAQALDEHATRAGGVLPVYKGVKALAGLGDRGAQLPAELYTGSGKLLMKGARALAPKITEKLLEHESGTVLLSTLGKMHDWTQERLKNLHLKSQTDEGLHQGQMQVAKESQVLWDLARKMNEKVPDEIEQQAAFAINAGLPHILADVNTDAPEIMPHVFESVTDGEGKAFGVTPEALKLAMDYEQNRIPLDQRERIDIAQQYHREMNAPLREGFRQERGKSEVEKTPASAEQVDWQETGTTPNPIAMGREQARRESVLGSQRAKVEAAHARAEKELGRKVYTDEQSRQPVRSARVDVEAAMNVGTRLVAEHPDVAAGLFPDLSGPKLERAIADSVLVARDRGVEGFPPEVGHLVDAQKWSGPKPVVGTLQGAERLIRQGEHEGAVVSSNAIAERFKARAEEKRAAGDRAGAAVDEARSRLTGTKMNRKVLKAQRRLDKAVKAAERATKDAAALEPKVREKAIAKARRGLEEEVRAHRSSVRAALYDASNEELSNLADEMGGWFPASVKRRIKGAEGSRSNSNHDLWSYARQEARKDWLITRPPQGVRGSLAMDELIDNYARRHNIDVRAGVDETQVLDEIMGRLNAAAEQREIAHGMVGKGLPESVDAGQLSRQLSLAGVDPHLVEMISNGEAESALATGSIGEIAAKMMQGTRIAALDDASKARILNAIEAQHELQANRGLTSEDVTTEGPTGKKSAPGDIREVKLPKKNPRNPDGLTPFETKVAEVVLADAKKIAAERGLERVGTKELRQAFDSAVGRATRAGKLEGQAVGLESAAKMSENAGARAQAGAQKGNTGNVTAGAGNLSGRGFARGESAGRVNARVASALRDVGVQERIYNRLDDLTRRQVEKAAADLRNAPGRFKPTLDIARQAKAAVEQHAAEVDKISPGAGLEYRLMAAEIPVTLAQAVDKGINPDYVIGGDVNQTVLGSARSGEGKLPPFRKGSERYERVAMKGPSNANEVALLGTRRIAGWVRNETARSLQARFGVAPAQVIGKPAEEEGLDVASVRNAPDEASRKTAIAALRKEATDKGYALLEGEGNAFGVIPAHLRSGQALVEAMAREGYTRWDPANIFGQTPAKQVGPGTVFIPTAVWDRFRRQLGEAGQVEKAFRKYYDKPLRVWKDHVLALSPRWQVNNIIGGVVTATAGGGIDFGTYGANFKRGMGIIRAIKNDTVDRLSAEDQAIAANLDPQLHQGSEPSRMGDAPAIGVENPKLPTRAKTKFVRGYKKVTNKSYEWNGMVDDANRLAVFLTEKDRLTDRQLMAHLKDDPQLGHVAGGDMNKLRDEVAVRLSLKVVGDFTRLTPIERGFVRRVLPFYPWMRHITKLALSMPITSPVRTAWLMHLSAMFGQAPEFGFLGSYIPVGGEQPDQSQDFLHIGRVNPFADASYGSGGSADYSLSNIPANIASQVTPVATAAAALGLGVDARTMGQISRPPGSGNLDDYGRDAYTPLIGRPSEAISYLGNLFPAGRIARAAVDGLEYGGKLPLRYGNGQVMKSQGRVLSSDRNAYAPLVDLLGVPVTGSERIGLAELRGRRDERRRRAAASRRRYAGSTSSGRPSAWGSSG